MSDELHLPGLERIVRSPEDITMPALEEHAERGLDIVDMAKQRTEAA